MFWATCIVSVHRFLSPRLKEETEAMGLNSTLLITGLLTHVKGNLDLSFLFYFIYL